MSHVTSGAYEVKGFEAVRFTRTGLNNMKLIRKYSAFPYGVMGRLHRIVPLALRRAYLASPGMTARVIPETPAGQRKLPFGTFGCPRSELDHALHLGFSIAVDQAKTEYTGRQIYREDQGDGFTQLQAKGMTFAQMAELDSGLRWLAWLAWDGWMEVNASPADIYPQKIPSGWTPRPNEWAELARHFGRPVNEGDSITWAPHLRGVKNLSSITVNKKILLYGGFGAELLEFMDSMRPEFERLFPDEHVTFDGSPSLGTIAEIQDAGFIPGEQEDRSINRWFATREFLEGPGRSPWPRVVQIPGKRGLTEYAVIQVTRFQGDTWDKLKDGKLARAIRQAQEAEIAPFSPSRGDDEEVVWRDWMNAVNAYNRVGLDETPGEVVDEELVRRYWTAQEKAVQALKEVDELVKLRLCHHPEKPGATPNGQRLKFHDMLLNEHDLAGKLVAARKAALERIDKLPSWEKKRFESKPVSPAEVNAALQVMSHRQLPATAWNRIAESRGTSPHVAKPSHAAELAAQALDSLIDAYQATRQEADEIGDDRSNKRARRAHVRCIRAARLVAMSGNRQLHHGIKARSITAWKLVRRQLHRIAYNAAPSVVVTNEIANEIAIEQ